MVRGKASNQPVDLSPHHAQMMKGALDMCLLAVISRQPNYGYEMLRILNEEGVPVPNESTIYPVLKRLAAKGLVEGHLEPSPEGPARKYYETTTAGEETLQLWAADWRDVRQGVDAVLDQSSVPGASGGPTTKTQHSKGGGQQ